MSAPDSDELGSTLIGLYIYNKDNKDIGTIKDVAFDSRLWTGRSSCCDRKRNTFDGADRYRFMHACT